MSCTQHCVRTAPSALLFSNALRRLSDRWTRNLHSYLHNRECSVSLDYGAFVSNM